MKSISYVVAFHSFPLRCSHVHAARNAGIPSSKPREKRRDTRGSADRARLTEGESRYWEQSAGEVCPSAPLSMSLVLSSSRRYTDALSVSVDQRAPLSLASRRSPSLASSLACSLARYPFHHPPFADDTGFSLSLLPTFFPVSDSLLLATAGSVSFRSPRRGALARFLSFALGTFTLGSRSTRSRRETNETET